MQHTTRKFAAIALTVISIPLAACGRSDRQTAAGDVGNPSTATPSSASTGGSAMTDTTTTHHSKLGGALVGAAAGHVLGHHALAGAAAGALIQHERNKHQR